MPGGLVISPIVRAPRQRAASLLVAAACAAGSPARAADAPTYATGKVVIRLAPGVAQDGAAWTGDAVLDAALRDLGVTTARPLLPHPAHPVRPERRPEALDRYWRVRFDGPRDPQAVARTLSVVPGVETAEAVPVCRVFSTPNDPSLPSQWAFRSNSPHSVNAESAWDLAVGDTTIALGVLDTGVDWQHPDLGGAAPYTGGNIWTNLAEANGLPGVDDDADGYVDDIRGYDFVDGVPVYPGEDGSTPDNDPSDFNGHGTHVAGIMAALTNNATGVAAVTWRCKLMPLRMGYSGTDPYSGGEAAYVQMDFAAEAMTYAADHGAAAVNCSWGSNSFSAFATAVDYALASGVVVVDAAGNNGSDSQLGNYLAQRDDCLDVAAVDSLDVRAAFSSYGDWVDISAPGLAVLSTYFDHWSGSHTYATLSGTSQAAPFVTAAAGLWRSLHPADSLASFRHRLLATAAAIDDFNTPDMRGQLGSGRLDLGAMIGTGGSAWTLAAGDSVTTNLTLADLGPNRRGAVLGVSTAGSVFALGRDGAALPGWPVSALGGPTGFLAAPSFNTPSAGRIGPSLGVVLTASDGLVRAWSAAGMPLGGNWPRALDGAIRGSAALGAIAPGLGGVTVVGTEAGSVWALDSTGTEVAGWPQHLAAPVRGTPTLVDLTGDGMRNIVAGTLSGCVYAWDAGGTPLAGWPVCVSDAVFTLPIAAGTTSNAAATVLVAQSNDNRLFAWNRAGVPQAGWPIQLAGTSLPAAPVIVDLTLDGWMEVIAASGTKLYAFRSNGTLLAGWPQSLPARIVGSPLVADIDGQGTNEIAVPCADGRLYAFTPAGTAVAGWPHVVGPAFGGTPVIGDTGGDGVPDIVASTDDGWLTAWPLPGALRGLELLQWPMAGHDASHGNRRTPIGETAVVPTRGAEHGLVARASAGVIDLAWPASQFDGVWRGELRLFDVSGRLAARLPLDRAGIARGSVRWQPTSPARTPLPGGIYWARLTAGATTATARLVLVP